MRTDNEIMDFIKNVLETRAVCKCCAERIDVTISLPDESHDRARKRSDGIVEAWGSLVDMLEAVQRTITSTRNNLEILDKDAGLIIKRMKDLIKEGD